MNGRSKFTVVAVAVAILASTVMAQENRALWSLSTYIQSAKIVIQHEYRKTHRKEDLYKAIDLLREASGRFGRVPEVYFMLGTWYSDIYALDTMVTYFDSVKISCADSSLEKKYREQCAKNKNFSKEMDKFCQKFWEESYNQGVSNLGQYDTLEAWIERDSARILAGESIPDSIHQYDSMKTKTFDLSLSGFQQAAMLKPEDTRSVDNIGILYQREKKYPEAIEYYQKAMAITGENAESVSKIAYAYIMIPDWKNSITWFEKLIGYEPDNTSALVNLSVAYSAIEDLEKSQFYNERLLEVEPGNSQALFNSGQYWIVKMQDAADSSSQLSDSIPSEKARKAEWETKVVECREKAVGYFEKVLADNPTDADALKRAGFLYLVGQKPEKAVEIFSKSLQVNPTDSDALDYLGRAYIQMGDFGRAVGPYEKMVESDPGDLKTWERLEELYRFTDQTQKANQARAKIDELKKL